MRENPDREPAVDHLPRPGNVSARVLARFIAGFFAAGDFEGRGS